MPRPSDVGVRVGVILYDAQTNAILLLKRAGKHCPNVWATPGGWMDRRDQSIEAACRREVFEETGISLTEYNSDMQLNSVTTENHEDFRCVTIYYDVFVDSRFPFEIKEPDKCSDMRWFDLDLLLEDEEIHLFPNLKEVLENFEGNPDFSFKFSTCAKMTKWRCGIFCKDCDALLQWNGSDRWKVTIQATECLNCGQIDINRVIVSPIESIWTDIATPSGTIRSDVSVGVINKNLDNIRFYVKTFRILKIPNPNFSWFKPWTWSSIEKMQTRDEFLDQINLTKALLPVRKPD